jgi:hypothetical protein
MPNPLTWLALPAAALVQFALKFAVNISKVRCCALPRVHCSACALLCPCLRRVV